MVLINTATYLNLNAFDYNKRLLLRYRFFVHKIDIISIQLTLLSTKTLDV